MADINQLAEKAKDLFQLLGADDMALEAVTSMVKQTEKAKTVGIKAGLVLKAAGDDPAQVEGGAAEGDTTDSDEAAEETEMVTEMSVSDLEKTITEQLAPIAQVLQAIMSALGASGGDTAPDAAAVTKEIATTLTTAIVTEVTKEIGTKLAGITLVTKELTTQLDLISKAVKDLAGDVPNGVAQGYRASSSPVTIVNNVADQQKNAGPDDLDKLIGLPI
jgi:hypothetical protein